MASRLAPTQARRVVTNTWSELTGWLHHNTDILELPQPEQQLLFELAQRLRDSLRSLAAHPDWGGLFFDASSASNLHPRLFETTRVRPHIHVETSRLFGARSRSVTHPDIAINLHVLRSLPATLELDEDGNPNLGWTPLSIQAQGRALARSVRLLEELARRAYDGYLFVVYVNKHARETAVDTRQVASWASWRPGPDGVSWATRHFRPKEPR